MDYKNIKWTQIILDESLATEHSALYIIPINQFTCKLIYVDDVGDKRYLTALGSDANYEYIQPTPATTWSILHPLDKIVSVTIQDSSGREIEGEVSVNDGNMVIVEFNSAINGKVILN